MRFTHIIRLDKIKMYLHFQTSQVTNDLFENKISRTSNKRRSRSKQKITGGKLYQPTMHCAEAKQACQHDLNYNHIINLKLTVINGNDLYSITREKNLEKKIY